MKSSIQNKFSLLPLKKQKLVIRLQGIILSAALEIGETLNNGRMAFVTDKGPVAFLCVKQNSDYVEVVFFKGVLLNDPKELLKGKSKEIRRFKIKTENEIPVLQIRRWLRESVNLK